jgi:hypothetical protein
MFGLWCRAMLPKTLALTVQLIALLLLVSLLLLVVRISLDGWVELAGFGVTAAIIIWLWHKLRLHDYFFG